MARRYYTADAIANVGNMALNLFATAPDRAEARSYKKAALADRSANTNLRDQELGHAKVKERNAVSRHAQDSERQWAEYDQRDTHHLETLDDRNRGRESAETISRASALNDPGLRARVLDREAVSPDALTKGNIGYQGRVAGSQQAARKYADFEAQRREAQAILNYEASQPLPGGVEGPRPPAPQLGPNELPPPRPKGQVSDATNIARNLRQAVRAEINSMTKDGFTPVGPQAERLQQLRMLLTMPENEIVQMYERSLSAPVESAPAD
jgi:hypothetical protein